MALVGTIFASKPIKLMNIKFAFTAWALLLVLQVQANPISRKEARQVAQSFVAIDDASSDNVPNAPYYIFSRGAGKGFVIASGDDEVAPILGYTDQGDYAPNNMPDGLKNMLNAWAKKIGDLQQKQKTRTRQMPKRSVRQRLQLPAYKNAWVDVHPLVKTKWNQDYPYNMFAPNRSDNGQKTLSGCVATAASQIIYYYRKDNPDALLYATPTYSGDWFHAPVTFSLPAGTPVRYDLMKLSGTGTLKQDTAVAVLMYAAGTCAGLGYGYQDGTATAGNIDKMGTAMDNQFNISSKYVGKWNYSQEGWESLAYSNVRDGQPLLYSGASETQGGHAVVLDGYQASTGLFHFNFGWGGYGDGYYTVDDSTGMNGFNTGQSALVNIVPKRQKLSGRLVADKMFYRTDGQITATVKNMGTLAYKGVYVYCAFTKTLPSRSTDNEISTSIASGDSATFTFTYRPTQKKRLYIWLADANKNILDTMSVEVSQSVADLHLNSIRVDAGTATVEHDGVTYQQVNNTQANIAVNLTNGENGSYCQPAFICQVDSLNGTTGAWDKCASRVINKLIFEVGQTRDTLFTFTGLQPNRYYRAMMTKRVSAGVTSEMIFDTPDSIVYFITKYPTLEVVAKGRKATVTGDWNAAIFTSKAQDAAVTSYDMTNVVQLSEQPVAANENALFFTAAPIEGSANVVANGVCDSLLIHTRSEFANAKAFTARKAVLVLDDAKAGEWNDVFMPFSAPLPYGMQGRVVNTIERSRLTVSNVREAEAMKPLLYLADREGLNTIEATDVALSTDTVGSLVDGFWKGSTLKTSLSRQASLLKTPATRLTAFVANEKGTAVAPFATELDSVYRSGYRVFNSSDVAADRNYMQLADSINLAYQVIKEYGKGAEVFLADSLKKFEDMFTYYTCGGDKYMQVRQAYINLGATIRAFLANPVVDAIREVEIGTDVKADEDAPLQYFTLNGQQLARPQRGIVIVKKGHKTWKMVVK